MTDVRGAQRGVAWRRGARGEAWVALALALLVALFFWRFVTPKVEDRVAFPGGEFTDRFYASRLFAGRELAAGRLPLWNPYADSGRPFLADPQAGALYPPALAVAWLGSQGGDLAVEAVQLEVIAHFFLAGLFTYLFVLRLLRRDRAAAGRPGGGHLGALVAAVTFAFGGYLTSTPAPALNVLETLAWLPLFLLSLDSVSGRPSARSIGAAAAVLGIAALAGDAGTLLVAVAAGALFYAYRTRAARAEDKESGSVRLTAPGPAATFLAIVGLAAGLAAVQLLPALESWLLSEVRAPSSAGAQTPLQLLDLLLPGIASLGGAPLYAGVLPLWLAVAAVATRRDRHTIFWAVLAAVALPAAFVLAAGNGLPGLAGAVGLFSLSLAVLAGFGCDALMRSLPRGGKAAFMAAFLMLAWAPVAYLAVALGFFVASKAAGGSASTAALVDRAALMAIMSLLAASLAAARLWGWLPWRVIGALMLAVIVFDLFTVNWQNNQSALHQRFPSTPAVQSMQADDRLLRVDLEALPGNAGVVHSLEDIRGAGPWRIRTYGELLRALPADRYRALLGVRYVVTAGKAPAGAVPVALSGDAPVYELPYPMPRAWLVGQAQVEPNGAQALAALTSPGFDPRQTVIVDREPAPRPAGGTVGEAPVTVDEPHRLVVETVSQAAAVLVVSEVHYPGWRAIVDGVPAQILRADHALRAVALAPGHHTVEMVYQPFSFQLGALISGASALFVAGAMAFGHRRRLNPTSWRME